MQPDEPCAKEANTSRMQSAADDLRGAVCDLKQLLTEMNGEKGADDCPKDSADVRPSICVAQIMNEYPDLLHEQAQKIRDVMKSMRGMF
jgi:uncharacterized protein YukE